MNSAHQRNEHPATAGGEAAQARGGACAAHPLGGLFALTLFNALLMFVIFLVLAVRLPKATEAHDREPVEICGSATP